MKAVMPTLSCARPAPAPPAASSEHNGSINPFQIITTVTTQAVEPVILSLVGNYALNIEWSDGHRTGIYPWDMLRALCPCPQCTGKPTS